MLMEREDDDSSAKAAAFIDGVMRRFDLGDRWAFLAIHADGHCHGMSEGQPQRAVWFRGPAHQSSRHRRCRATAPRAGSSTRKPTSVELEIELYNNDPKAIEFLAPHCAFFSWGLELWPSDCQVPLPNASAFGHTRQPVVMDLWEHNHNGTAETFTTVGNWRQSGQVKFKGNVYTWSKHHEFLKFLDLPRRTSQAFELALSSGSYQAADKRLIENNGWRLRDSLEFSRDLDAYRSYVSGSRGEFTVAKDQNVRLRSGWFSERSAQYLASGRPVITQETGFSNVLPTGQGLFAFSTMERFWKPSRALTRLTTNIAVRLPGCAGYFSHDVVLKELLAEVGL